MADAALSTANAVLLEGQYVKPIGESMSDYEIVGEVAKKLGKYEEYTEGKTVKEWIRFGYEGFENLKNLVSWEELNEKGYYVIPPTPDGESMLSAMT